MNSSFTSSKSAKHHTNGQNPIEIIQNFEVAEAARAEAEFAAIDAEDLQSIEQYNAKMRETEAELRKSATAELQAYKNGEPSTLLDAAKKEALTLESTLQAQSQKKSGALITELIQSLPSYV